MAEIRINATGELKLYDSDDSNYVSFKSAGTVSSNVAWTLPSADGSSGQMLSTNGSGTLSWATASSADPTSADGDSLGTASLEWSDLFLADGGIIKFGNDQDVLLTHVADTGLLLNGTNVIQFNDASQNIGAPSNAILDINATDEIELNATAVDLNGTLDVSGNSQFSGTITVGVDGTGKDVKLFGDTASSYLEWDESADDLNLIASGLGVITAKDLGSGIHIRTSDSGASVDAEANQLVLEGGGSGVYRGMSILSPTDGGGTIFFGDSDNNKIGMIYYGHGQDNLVFKTNNANRMFIQSDGNIDIPVDDVGFSFGASQDVWFGGGNGEESLQINRGGSQVSNPVGTGAAVQFYVPGTSSPAEVQIYGGEAKAASTHYYQDQGDDNGDQWWVGQQGTAGDAGSDMCWTDYDSGSMDQEARLNQGGDWATEGTHSASTTIDYAEYFEWKTELANDGKITETYGLSVVLDNGKVRLAEAGEEAKVLGVVRPNNVSAMVGGEQLFRWKGRYEKNVWGEPVREEYTLVDWDETRTKLWKDGDTLPEGKSVGDVRGTYVHHHKYMKDRIPAKVLKLESELDRSEPNWHTLASNLTSEDLVVPSTDSEKSAANYTERSTIKRDKGKHKKGDKLTRKKINSSYDSSKSYTPRSERRKEWCIVGLIGQVEVRDTAIIPTHWTKMKNLETGIDMYYVFNK